MVSLDFILRNPMGSYNNDSSTFDSYDNLKMIFCIHLISFLSEIMARLDKIWMFDSGNNFCFIQISLLDLE